jgi:hypothetical protein
MFCGFDIGNDPIQPARGVDSTQVKTPDRGLGCNRLFVDYIVVDAEVTVDVPESVNRRM